MKRRQFLGILGSVPLALKLNPEIRAEKLKEIAPETGSFSSGIPTITKVIEPSLAPGWHNVKIADVQLRPSKRNGDHHFQFTLVSEDGQHGSMYLSERMPYEISKLAKATNVPFVHDSVDLTEMIGKKIQVSVTDSYGFRKVSVK